MGISILTFLDTDTICVHSRILNDLSDEPYAPGYYKVYKPEGVPEISPPLSQLQITGPFQTESEVEY